MTLMEESIAERMQDKMMLLNGLIEMNGKIWIDLDKAQHEKVDAYQSAVRELWRKQDEATEEEREAINAEIDRLDRRIKEDHDKYAAEVRVIAKEIEALNEMLKVCKRKMETE